ncbi:MULTISPECIES: hypothetical protein [unclassified Mesorhizobium]|uniref:hypothetical protein n=1 Tax=unclassified Mesorhizobium TaxID=325217 RepID=UPI0007FBF2A7|nr:MULTISPECIES: hypothetical protein [unclassified Mesorhizobium]TIV02418.1 MAG: hypothetical protein E5W04_13525 [Mesorhizobium sp.]OBQ81340.1 hypothetical protein A9K71_28085 [Mesorhizobium sp. WSM3873]PBB39306.1 hypothetical protein CK221_00220 [Mesorhizobium sp. WSM3868]PBB82251.1 hypothetical protein CK218_05150 [Mesorhizobium sp. WSM3879]PBB93642.1 hypothetical protein CK215_06810 [Mesorhizobium sp. WSM3864]
MKIFSLLKGLSGAEPRQAWQEDGEIARWTVDPLSHPVLDAMSERELGDMPFRLTAGRTVYETACR